MLKPSSALLGAAATVAAAPLLLAGCGSVAGDETGKGPQVAAAFYPLEYAAQRVVGERTDVVGLTDPGVEPHDLELTVQQTADLAESDLVVYERGMQPAVDAAVEENGPDHVVEAAEVVGLRPTEAGHEEETAEEHAEHAEGAGDPHFWLDPERMVDLAAEVRDQMSRIDPDHAETYTDNFETFRSDLVALDRDYRKGLSDCARETVVVSHDAFGYLERYGLHFEAIAGLSPDVEPSPAHLAELQRLIRSTGVTTVFSETLASPAMARSLAGDLGVETAVLDPIEGLGESTRDEDYLSLMRANLSALQEANQCN